MNESFFENNREKLKRDLKDNEMIILASGKEKYFSGDAAYRFRPNKNFYYYTGINFDNVYYVVFKANGEACEKMFFDEVDETMVKWIGSKLTKKFVLDNFKIKEEFIFDTENLVRQLKKDIAIHNIQNVYLDILENEKNPEKMDLTHKDNALKSYLFKALGENKEINFVSIEEITKLHRPFKEDCEIECIEKAIDITARALHIVLKNIKSCKTENEVEAYFDFSTKKDGVRFNGFDSIVASGMNGTILHYTDNNSKIEEGSLVLLDVGQEYENYSSDVSRTYPTNGHFSDIQRKVYQIVLETNKAVIESIKIGMTFKELNEIAKTLLSVKLTSEGLLKEGEDISKYYYHSVSHPLGLDTHDLRGSNPVIEDGMVITVEPGLYMANLGIGIRIEDDVYVSKKGNKVLTEKIPKEISDIERIINE